ncbi:MAG: HD domain-containing protein [Synergistaceae bacterium]|nr:HD domain-containing protein [Synergistaceae bacterium]
MFADLEKIKEMFESYARSFDLSIPMIRVKHTHSYDVMRVGERLTDELAWNADAKNAGLAACLLHDAGRFSQYRDFGTYNDGASVDHGERGYEELLSESARYASATDGEAWEAILQTVKWHNKKSLPELAPEVMPFCRLVRDADKLDVFELVQRRMDNGTIEELLPRHKIDAPLSGPLLDEIEENWSGSYKNASSLLDFLLVQLTWALDVNFAPSLRMLEESGALTRIRARFPRDDRRVQNVLDDLFSRIEARKLRVL